jgi:hypothetical protein
MPVQGRKSSAPAPTLEIEKLTGPGIWRVCDTPHLVGVVYCLRLVSRLFFLARDPKEPLYENRPPFKPHSPLLICRN